MSNHSAPREYTWFARIDFVEYISRRDGQDVYIDHLLKDQIFLKAVADVKSHLVTLTNASLRVEAEARVEFMPASFRRKGWLEKTITLCTYRSDLPERDARFVKLPTRDIEASRDTSYIEMLREPYLKYKPEQNSEISRLDDELDYISFWVKAYHEEFRGVLNDRRLVSMAMATRHFGPDHFSDRIGVVATALGDKRPNLAEWSLRMALVIQLCKWTNLEVIELDYDPKQLHPEVFIEGFWRNQPDLEG